MQFWALRKKIRFELNMPNFWKAESVFYRKKAVILIKIDCFNRNLLLHVLR